MHPSPSWRAGNRVFSIQVSNTGAAGLHDHLFTMSSLSRRACYKCGNVGHYAGEWYNIYSTVVTTLTYLQRFALHQSAFAIIVSDKIFLSTLPYG